MYSKQDLEKKTMDDLRKIAKELKIKRWYELRKYDLIEEIAKETTKASVQNNVEGKEESSMCNKAVENKGHQNASGAQTGVLTDSKSKYLKNIKKGTIVAFKVKVFGNEKVKSAAVENVSQKRQMLKLKTSYGKEFVVPFSDVIWVRTGSRWPKGVYELLKGVNNNVTESEESK